MRLKGIIEVAQVLDRYNEKDEFLSAEHDEIFLPGPPPEQMSAEDLQVMEDNHASWSKEYECWQAFT